ncbi:hypothetical protein [Endozoicomonas sp. GU-1]|nr:hypothetical protein [Endozoicomonas sp. GU-1]WBA83553.1 hypothetical protein O2T12_10705 [Endozoicomonas sp. GU-1]
MLAGNSSRSKWVLDFFGLDFDEIIEREGSEEANARYTRMVVI